MKIYIKAKPVYLAFWIPLSALKWKIATKYVTQEGWTSDTLKRLYHAAKEYVRQYGHFTLVDVRSAEGERVIVKI